VRRDPVAEKEDRAEEKRCSLTMLVLYSFLWLILWWHLNALMAP
jgi:hypothetical protein